jgi:hypothetical protein
MVALGPRSAAAPLGASFEPFLSGNVAWGPSPVPGLDEDAAAIFGSSAAGISDLHPRGRATLDLPVLEGSTTVVARWKDRAPWLFGRLFGGGRGVILNIPNCSDECALHFRPLFLALPNDSWSRARAQRAHRTEVGQPWAFEGLGPGGGRTQSHLPVAEEATRKLVTPDRTGPTRSRSTETLREPSLRAEREVDLRPRALAAAAVSPTLGDVHAQVDLSPYLAVVLLGLLVGELALRLWARRNPAHPDAQPTS